MYRLIIFFILIFALYYLLRFFLKDLFPLRKKPETKTGIDELVQDPVCQTYVPKSIALKKKIEGQTQYFCKQECLDRFLETKAKN